MRRTESIGRRGSLRLLLLVLLLVGLVQAEARVTALTLGRGEAAAGTGPLRNLLLFRPLLCRLFAVEEFKLLQHRLLLATADRRLLASWLRWRVQVVVREIRGLFECN